MNHTFIQSLRAQPVRHGSKENDVDARSIESPATAAASVPYPDRVGMRQPVLPLGETAWDAGRGLAQRCRETAFSA